MYISLVPVGFGNFVSLDKVVAITAYSSNPILSLVRELRSLSKVTDFTSNRATKTVLFLISGDVVLSALSPETITKRIEK